MIADFFKKARLYAIAGVKGVGRSTLLQTLVYELCDQDKEKKCLYCFNGKKAGDTSNLPKHTYLVDFSEPPINTGMIYLQSNWVKTDHGLSAVIVDDYRFLLRLDSFNNLELSKDEKILCLLTRLKALTELYDIPVIISCDVDDDYIYGRSDKRPMISDIQESQYIKAFADKIILMYRDEMFDPESERKGVTELRAVNPHDESYKERRFAYMSEIGKYCELQELA